MLLQNNRFPSNWHQNNDKKLHHVEPDLMPVAWNCCNFIFYFEITDFQAVDASCWEILKFHFRFITK
jgi:hypothetical protein